jgi:hypothetical protein
VIDDLPEITAAERWARSFIERACVVAGLAIVLALVWL